MLDRLRTLSDRAWYSILRATKYRNRPYSEFYEAVMRRRIARGNPRWAVGDMWDEIGRLQFDFLVRHGLKPRHRLLDFGCGCLRGGLHFISYLDESHYTGVDISPEILDAGRAFLRDAHLENKKPLLRRTSGLTFDWHIGPPFDFIIAQSVLTHMPLEDVAECLANIHKVLSPTGSFFATWFESDRVAHNKEFDTFSFPLPTLRDIGARHSLDLQPMDDYIHPRGQKMLRCRLVSTAVPAHT